MAFFKFLDRRFVSHLASGRIRLGNLMRYRLLEVITGDRWIGDIEEGHAVTSVSGRHEPDDPNPELLSRLKEAGVLGGDFSQSRISISNMRIGTSLQGYVFCFSSGDLSELTRYMSDPSRAYAYDGCVRISDPELLTRRLGQARPVTAPPFDTFDLFLNPVSYSDRPDDFLGVGVTQADTFVKRPIYSAQREWRVFLQPTGLHPATPLPDYLDLEIDPAGLFVPVDIDVSPADVSPVRPIARDELVGMLKAVISDSNAGAEKPRSAEDRFRQNRAAVLSAYWQLREREGLGSPDLDRYIARNAADYVIIRALRDFLLGL